MSKTAKKIVSTYDCSKWHRGDFTTCPHCDAEAPSLRWDATAVILVTDTVWGKVSGFAVVSECQKCFEKSWVHRDFGQIVFMAERGTWPKAWGNVAAKAKRDKNVAAARDWAFGLCGKCVRLTSATCDVSARRTCKIGIGPVVMECEKFKQAKEPDRG